MRKRLLQLIATLTCRAPWMTLGAVGLLTLVAAHLAFVASDQLFKSDLTEFLPPEREYARVYNDAKASFGSFHYMIVAFQADLRGKEEALKETARRFALAIEGRSDLIAASERRFDTGASDYQDQFPFSDKNSVNLMTEEDWERIDERLRPEAVDAALQRIVTTLQATEPNRSRDRLLQDPFDVDSVILRRLLRSRGPIDIVSLRDGYIMSEDGQTLLMILRPQRSATDHRFARDLMDFLRHAGEGVFLRNPYLRTEGRVRIGFIGPHVETDYVARLIQRDLQAAFVVSFVGVLLLFMLTFRRPAALLFVGLPLLIGVVWALGVTALTVGRLTTITFSIATVLVGLGVDFAVHIYNRFAEEHRRGAGTRVALERAIVQTGEGILTGAVTSAVAFYGLMLTTFPGFRELGIVAGTGILCCLAAVYLALPALILANARIWGRLHRVPRPATFGLSGLATSVIGYPRATLVIGVAVTAYLAFFAQGVEFSGDWSPRGELPEEYRVLERRVERDFREGDRRFDLPGPPIIAIVSGDTLQEALEANDRLYDNLEAAYERFPTLLSCDSLRKALPARRSQEESRKRISARLARELGGLEKRVQAAGASLGLSPLVFEPFIARLANLRNVSETAPYLDVRAGDADPTLVRQAWDYAVRENLNGDGGQEGERYRVITRIFPRARLLEAEEPVWTPAPPPAFFRTLSDGVDKVAFTGDAMLMAEATRADLRRDMARAVLFVAVAVYLLLCLHFRNARLAALAMMPVVCSLLWTLGVMKLAGLRLDFLNAIVLPMIIGLGIDDGIHILQRYREDRTTRGDGGKEDDVEAAVRHSGRAVVITSLTTMIGFGALSLAHFRGLREMGILVILGVGFSLVATLTLMPTLLSVAGERLRLLDAVGRDRGVERRAGKD